MHYRNMTDRHPIHFADKRDQADYNSVKYVIMWIENIIVHQYWFVWDPVRPIRTWCTWWLVKVLSRRQLTVYKWTCNSRLSAPQPGSVNSEVVRRGRRWWSSCEWREERRSEGVWKSSRRRPSDCLVDKPITATAWWLPLLESVP